MWPPVLVKRHPVERQGPLYFAPSDARVRKEDASVGLPLHITIFIASQLPTRYNTVAINLTSESETQVKA